MSLLAEDRRAYHREICAGLLGRRNGFLSNADSSNATSCDFAERLALQLPFSPSATPPSAQTLGSEFTKTTMRFLEASFGRLIHLRPGRWHFKVSARPGIALFDQYAHLTELAALALKYREVASVLAGDYVIVPDIVVARLPLSDDDINRGADLVSDEPFARLTGLRSSNRPHTRPLLHASISCKWTIRSDRVQNIRTEALNLLRNRKGHAPHIVGVTFEPLPSRLAAIARGTGDMDCVYHGALLELRQAVAESGDQDNIETLEALVEGNRLRDITDLPFDLAI